MEPDMLSKEITYEEERKKSRIYQTTIEKQKLPKVMIISVLLLEISAMSGMAYLIYLFYFS
jgi:hypothetical protein